MAKKPQPKSKSTLSRRTPASPLPPLRLEWIDPATLDDNPANWRIHPAEQLAALDAVLGDPEIGWAGVLLFNEQTRRLIDGHGRKKHWVEKHPGEPVPVLIGSWSAEAEKKILLTLDPMASMAQANAEQLELLRSATPLGESLAGLSAQLDQMLSAARASLQATAGEQPPPSAGGAAGDVADQFKIVITCRDEAHQTELLDRFDREGLESKALVG